MEQLFHTILLNMIVNILETRPNIGCRTLVNRHLCKIVPALVRELEDWIVDVRLKASQLLYSLILNAEVHITHHLEKILDGMYRASGDEDERVVRNVSYLHTLHNFHIGGKFQVV
jgi:dynein assembly factor 5